MVWEVETHVEAHTILDLVLGALRTDLCALLCPQRAEAHLGFLAERIFQAPPPLSGIQPWSGCFSPEPQFFLVESCSRPWTCSLLLGATVPRLPQCPEPGDACRCCCSCLDTCGTSVPVLRGTMASHQRLHGIQQPCCLPAAPFPRLPRPQQLGSPACCQSPISPDLG